MDYSFGSLVLPQLRVVQRISYFLDQGEVEVLVEEVPEEEVLQGEAAEEEVVVQAEVLPGL